jgi:hypothetical protein
VNQPRGQLVGASEVFFRVLAVVASSEAELNLNHFTVFRNPSAAVDLGEFGDVVAAS